MNRWYRAYEGTVTDAKLAKAALRAGVSRSVVIASWHCLLEDAAKENKGGTFTTDAEGIAAILIEPLVVMENVMKAFNDVGLIVDGVLEKWSKRQYESDSSTERSRKCRKKKKEAAGAPPPAPPPPEKIDATLQQRAATPPETETETETETEKSKALGLSPSADAAKADLFGSSPTAPPAPADASVDAKTAEYEAAFETAWQCYPERSGGNSKADAKKAFLARCRAGVAPTALIAGTKRYRAYCEAKGDLHTEFVKQASTFFGPGEHYLSPWNYTPPNRPQAAARPGPAAELNHGAFPVKRTGRDINELFKGNSNG